jgi:hypothetical protein
MRENFRSADWNESKREECGAVGFQQANRHIPRHGGQGFPQLLSNEHYSKATACTPVRGLGR